MKTEKKGPGRPPGGKKYGGRQKGTPNKISSKVRDILAHVTDEYYNSPLFQEDLQSLTPKDRIQSMERFANYIVPKLQSTTLDIEQESQKTIEDKLLELSDPDNK